MKAVILESYVMEEGDLDWSGVKALIPDTTSYVRTAYEEIAPPHRRRRGGLPQQVPDGRSDSGSVSEPEVRGHHRHRHRQSRLGGVPPPRRRRRQRARLLDLQRRPDDLQSAPRHLPVRRAVRSRRQGRLLAVGYPGKLWAAAPSGAVRQDLRHLRLRQHRPPDRPHRQGLRDAGPRLHPHRPAGVFRRRRGVRGV